MSASALAAKYDKIAASIEDDAEWFVDDSIDDADIAEGLRLAAKFLRRRGVCAACVDKVLEKS